MVHLTFQTNNKCDYSVQVWTKTLDIWMEKKHGYKPHNTHFWKTPGGSSSPAFVAAADPETALAGNIDDVWENSPYDYPKKEELWEKDASGRHKMYIEYGWTTLSNREGEMIGTDGEVISGTPIHPWDQQFTIKLRKITDWTEAEQEELNIWFSAYLGCQDYLYRGEETYTAEELRAWQDNLDYSQKTTIHSLLQADHSLLKKESDADLLDPSFVCRICKAIVDEKFGNNPAPVYPSRYKCCNVCNQAFVLPFRMEMMDQIEDVAIKEESRNPFKYPRTEKLDRREGSLVGACVFDYKKRHKMGAMCSEKRQAMWCCEDRHTLVAQQELLTKYLKMMVQNKGVPNLSGGSVERLKKAEKLMKSANEIKTKSLAYMKQKEEEVRLVEQANEQEKAEIRQKANEARKTLERVKRVSAPKDKQIDRLKTEIVKRDERIAELKILEGVIKSLDGRERARICSEQIAKKIGTYDGMDDFTDEPRDIPAWALDDFRQASQAKMMAEVKAKARAAKPVKKTYSLTKCQYCDKQCRANQLQDVWGDMLCGSCARKAGQ